MILSHRRRLVRPAMTLLALALAVPAPVVRPADAAVVICRRNNNLRLRPDACKRRETQVEAAELGVTGPAGAQGAPGVSGREVVTAEAPAVPVASGDTHFLSAECPAGKTVLGGGCVTESSFFTVTRSAPSSVSANPQYWECSFYNTAGYGIVASFSAYAVCATVAP